MSKSKKVPENFDKIYVTDTSALIDEPDLIIELTNDNNLVCIPWMVHRELTTAKKDRMIGRRAQRALRNINEYRKYENPYLMLLNVNWEGINNYKPAGILERNVPDDEILAAALSVIKLEFARGKNVVLLTHDIGMQVKGRELRFNGDSDGYLSVQEWNQDLGDTEEQLKMQTIEVPKSVAKDKKLKGRLPLELIGNQDKILENSGLLIKVVGEKGSSYISHAARKKNDYIHLLNEKKSIFSITQRPIIEIDSGTRQNWEQIHAIHSLLDLDISYNALIGQAGTGKTLLALASAFHYLVKSNRNFERLYITRSPVSFGNTLGYLPGTFEEKMNAWVQGMLDNIKQLRALNPDMSNQIDLLTNGESSKEASNGRNKNSGNRKKVEILSFEHIRGRTFNDSVIIIDEVQNMRREEVITFATRLGEGSRLIMTGDPSQIDDNYLTEQRNGLVWLAKLMKGDSVFSHTYMSETVRSQAVQAFLKRLNNQK